MTPRIWDFITDLPTNIHDLASPELASLLSVWHDQKDRLRSSDAIRNFNDKLQREWAIETGIIENLYTIDRGITQILIEKGIHASLIPHGTTDKPVELIIDLVEDQQSVLEGLFDFVAHRRELTTSYIKELHQAFTRSQDTTIAIDPTGKKIRVSLLKGDWKQTPNNPQRPDGSVYEYCPPEHVAAEVENLIRMHRNHDTNVPPEVSAAWLHHRFTQIHPFQDGNGRVARALATLIFIQSGGFPLVINRDDRNEYITALEVADVGDLKALIGLFIKVQKRAFIRALSTSEDVLRTTDHVDKVIGAISQKLQARGSEILHAAYENSHRLECICLERMIEISTKIKDELTKTGFDYSIYADRSTAQNDFWFRPQIVEIAQMLGYWANLTAYRSWVKIAIRGDRRVSIVVSFHALGSQFIGAMISTAFVEYRGVGEDDQQEVEGPFMLSTEPFQFSHADDVDALSTRFKEWLENVILVGIDHWRKQL